MRGIARGFTLVELMIVAAIIGILVAVALPAYENYSVRAKMSEVILAMSACRTSIADVYQSNGSPPGAGNWGCETVVTQYVASLATDDDGKVTATVWNINAIVNAQVVTMIPMVSATVAAATAVNMGQGLYGWMCGGIGTTIEKKYLPSSCRGD
ncbi:MAG: pilin [Burkholderiales bacterium]